MMAQTATQTAPAAPAAGDKASGCSCCSGDVANMKPGDKCPMMKDGKIIFDGTPQELVASTDPFVGNFISEVREESGLFINGEFILNATK